MKSGFVVIWRKFQETSFYKDTHAVHLAIHLILKANHEAKTIVFNGKPLPIERGQCVCGRDVLARELGMNSSLVYRKLKILEKVCFLNIKSNNKFSLITILNYDTYQSIKPKAEHQIEQLANNQRTTSEQQNDTNNNTTIKPLKPVFMPPTIEEVTAYCSERKNNINPTKFIAHYQARGWKFKGGQSVKDWKACVITWEENNFGEKDGSSQPSKRFL